MVRVVSAHFLTQNRVLFADRKVSVVPTPLSNAPHCAAQSLRGRLPHHRPTAAPRPAPVMGETQEVERTWSVTSVVLATGYLAGWTAKGNQPSFVGMQCQAIFAKALGQHLHHPPRVFFVPEQDYEIVRVPAEFLQKVFNTRSLLLATLSLSA